MKLTFLTLLLFVSTVFSQVTINSKMFSDDAWRGIKLPGGHVTGVEYNYYGFTNGAAIYSQIREVGPLKSKNDETDFYVNYASRINGVETKIIYQSYSWPNADGWFKANEVGFEMKFNYPQYFNPKIILFYELHRFQNYYFETTIESAFILGSSIEFGFSNNFGVWVDEYEFSQKMKIEREFVLSKVNIAPYFIHAHNYVREKTYFGAGLNLQIKF